MRLTLLHTNDIHGRVDGLARIAALVERIREETPHRVIYVDAGDVEETTTRLSNLTKGVAMHRLLSASGCEAAAVGNAVWLRYGPQAVPAEASAASYPLLLANLEPVEGVRKTALIAQFGREGGRAWELAHGLEVDPIRPVVPEERVVESLDFTDPLISRDALLVAAEQALNRALRAPLLAGRAIRGALLRLETERGAIWERTTTFGEALAERDRLWRVLRVVLDEAKIPGPIATLRLELRGLAPIHGRQLELFPGPRDRKEELEECLRQLGARYGACPVSRIVEVEPWSRIPERRLALIDYDP